MLLAAKRQRIPTLILSATLADSPLELYAAGQVLGLHDGDPEETLANFGKRLNPFYSWARSHGCGTGPRGMQFFGTDDERVAVMERIHTKLLPERGVRTRISDLGSAFPETQITAELYDPGSPERVDELYAQMTAALAALSERASHDRDSENPFTQLIRARQEVELIKVPIAVELAKDLVAQGRSVALFVNFRQTVEELCKRLGTGCFVDGTQTGDRGARERASCVENFQADRERIIVCNSDSGGVGISLHDLRGQYPRGTVIFPGFSAKVLRQILGRVWRDDSKSKSIQRILCLAGTVEEALAETLERKLSCLDALLDGDLAR